MYYIILLVFIDGGVHCDKVDRNESSPRKVQHDNILHSPKRVIGQDYLNNPTYVFVFSKYIMFLNLSFYVWHPLFFSPFKLLGIKGHRAFY